MSGDTMIAPNAPAAVTRWTQARSAFLDLLAVVALIWALPLLALAFSVAVRFLRGTL